ncbi:MAG: adenosylcobinamide-phosphate synthase CbiB [Desulfocapsaceae bacterium]|nr:adenosylcobinamide-phosphate synthase CbiB [Desulfocapsaceae bacterium]
MVFEFFLISAVVLDLIFGEPRWLVHPVQIMGGVAQKTEKLFRVLIPHESWAGALTFLVTFMISVGGVTLVLVIAGQYSTALQTCIAIVFLYLLVAIRDLLEHSKAVYTALTLSDLAEARKSVGRIVGRDTDQMDRKEVCRACIETVAENFVDGIAAPLFWAVIFSMTAPFTSMTPISLAAVGMTAYKVINTMDSMFGYKNATYLRFGRVAAWVDDAVNFIPARLGGLCIIVGAFMLRYDYQNSFRVFCQDRLKHASPNAGHPEAAVAGALGIQLGGPAKYFGQLVEKPYIGRASIDLSAEHILQVNTLILTSTFVFIVFSYLVRAFFLLPNTVFQLQ